MVIIIMGNRCFIIFIAYKGLHGEKCPTVTQSLPWKKWCVVCVFEKVNENLVCRAVAQNLYYATNFVIDLRKVNISDIAADGVIYHSQACPSSLFYINKENGKICTKAETNSSEIFDVYKLQRQDSKSFSKVLWRYLQSL